MTSIFNLIIIKASTTRQGLKQVRKSNDILENDLPSRKLALLYYHNNTCVCAITLEMMSRLLYQINVRNLYLVVLGFYVCH